jgi:hypothetical protein
MNTVVGSSVKLDLYARKNSDEGHRISRRVLYVRSELPRQQVHMDFGGGASLIDTQIDKTCV